MASSQTASTIASGNLQDLVSSSASATIYPPLEAVTQVLQSRFRAELVYTSIGARELLVVNPWKVLANVNDASRRNYYQRSFLPSASLTSNEPPPTPSAIAKDLQPHIFSFASQILLTLSRQQQDQVLISRGVTGSGKSHSLALLTSQLVYTSLENGGASTRTSKSKSLHKQINAIPTILNAFTQRKSASNPTASCASSLFELHWSLDVTRPSLVGAKIVLWGLAKTPVNAPLRRDERSYNVFYQFLEGATPAERDLYQLEDPSSYALLASSGTYHLPSTQGPWTSESHGMSELRSALKTLGFKSKHLSSLFSLLVAILNLSNVTFTKPDSGANSAEISYASRPALSMACRMLGVEEEDLILCLTNRTGYVKKEVVNVLLDERESTKQRDTFIRDLWALCVIWVVESVNSRLVPSSATDSGEDLETRILSILDLPGPGIPPQSERASQHQPLLSFSDASSASRATICGLDELLANFGNEVLFERIKVGEDARRGGMAQDGILDDAETSKTSLDEAFGEGLRILVGGSGLAAIKMNMTTGLLGSLSKAAVHVKKAPPVPPAEDTEKKEDALVNDLVSKFAGVRGFEVPNPPSLGGDSEERRRFVMRHFGGMQPQTYSASQLASRDADMLDPAFVQLGRTSGEPFVKKLFGGPALGMEVHGRDEGVVVRSQVRSVPLRLPTRHLQNDENEAEDDDELPIERTHPLTTQMRWSLGVVGSALDRLMHVAPPWVLTCLVPNISQSPNSFGKGVVKSQLNLHHVLSAIRFHHVAPFIIEIRREDFLERYVPRMQGTWDERFRQCVRSNGWREGGTDYKVGHRSVWLTYPTWKSAEDLVRARELESMAGTEDVGLHSRYDLIDNRNSDDEGDTEDLVPTHLRQTTHGYWDGDDGYRDEEGSVFRDPATAGSGGQYGHVNNADIPPSPYVATPRQDGSGAPANDEMQVTAAVEKVATSRSRRWWLRIVWLCTWWVPTFMMKWLGRMKRPDIRLAWREKVTICLLIALINGIILFYIILFGRLLCPEFDKAWTTEELNQHQGDDDWWAAVQGNVYDLSNFIHRQHSDSNTGPSNTEDVLQPLAGKDLTQYFPVPLTLGCRDLVSNSLLQLQVKNASGAVPQAVHKSGALAVDTSSRLHESNWYTERFLPEINNYKKGPLVWDPKKLKEWAADDVIEKYWAVYDTRVFDLTDYFYTIENNRNVDEYKFLDEEITNVIQGRSGQDVTEALDKVLDGLDPVVRDRNMFCLDNVFRVGLIDFRFGPRCQVQNYLLIIASSILMASIGLKFLAALQLSPKRTPELQDKFIICQVPCYTEGEESLRRTVDSLAALDYDDKRKLIFIICDGNIIGSGNDRTTPRIVLDILGVDPKIDPEPLLFKSIGEGSKALNYGKVYSGLYEFEGHVVPYMVIVKVGKPTERAKPGNRGKRDSQILLMHYLNRVHFDAPMNPLELEIYHQMRNVIGIDPAFYEYIFTIDADTSVTPDSLNRLVASCSDDARIIGICGETKLDNEEGSWWTMIQVYEYYISHHLNKAFESLFGSVTCLPGCFSVYRIRTADKGRPIIISNRIIDEYAEPNVDTLHKKNLFSLGEDRFLTTLLMKHFPTFKTKFNPEAVAHTIAPDSFRILFSQRRRWINSTVHNLCELVLLPELFGFCCFSMRFFVFLDLVGTIILPATVVYIAYLIVVVSLGRQSVPLIALIMISVTYGLQAVIFIIKREFMLIGWMVVYLLSYPVYSFLLPVYSFWCMDEFSWGNTRLVVGEGKEKKVIMNEDEKFDESMIPLKKFSEYEAEAWETGTRRSDDTGYYDSKGNNGNKISGRPHRSRDPSPHTYQQASQSGDYYRDTNALSKPASIMSHSNHSHSHIPPGAQMGGTPQLPFMPFGGGPGSVHGSDYGGPPMQFQGPGSMYGMGMMGPPSLPFMNPMGSGSMAGSQSGAFGMMQPPPTIGQARPISTFSMATTAGPFMGPSQNPNPTDEELFNALRTYLSTQDLMTVTKKTTREAIAARFPKADLAGKKDFLNQSIDAILSET